LGSKGSLAAFVFSHRLFVIKAMLQSFAHHAFKSHFLQ